MSNISHAVKPEFDFWEFVGCARCHLAFNSDLGVPQIPFWLTECGHILCNSHLNADQSCAQCGERGIQLVPLQQDMDAPMSDWFRSVPYSFDGAASAAKFQQETLASLVRYYKDKSRKTMDRLRSEIEEKKALKNEIDDLRHQNRQLQQYMGPSDTVNANGKRPMTGSHRAGTNSSPRSIITPLAPNRLTLPPGQDAPNFSRQQGPDDSQMAGNSNGFQMQMQRPGSSRFVEQYAYNPPQTSQFQPLQLSHKQAAPTRQHQARQAQNQQRTMMPPPPPPESTRAVRVHGGGGVFKPPAPRRSLNSANLQINTLLSRHDSSQRSDQNQPVTRDRRQTVPPPTPQAHTQAPNRSVFTPLVTQAQAQAQNQTLHPGNQASSFTPTMDLHTAQSSARFSGPPSNNRFIPSRTNTNPDPGNQLFVPPTPMNGSKPFAAPRAPSRAMNGSHAPFDQGGQRMPFVPTQSRFG